MGNLLFVGVTCADVVINVDRLPARAEDVVVYGQRMTLGGCAFNAFSAARALCGQASLLSPVGRGAFGDFVRNGLVDEGVPILLENPSMDNGCCYCFVEPDGERTFVAYHGADYHYERSWLEAVDMSDVDAVYACGLEVEDPTGEVVVEFLERRCADKTIYFTPGPRPGDVPLELLERVLALHPVLHMNGEEAVLCARRLGFPECADDACAGRQLVERATEHLARVAGNTAIVTLGAEGCLYDTGVRRGMVAGAPARVVDTIGAGDFHIGAVMACLHRGDALEDALACANRVAAAVVATAGAHLDAAEVRAAAR